MTRQFLYAWAALLACSATLLAADDKKSPSPAEQAKAVEAAKQQMMAGGPIGNDPFLKQFDRDRDGKLSPIEQRMAREAWEKMRRNNGGPQRGFTPGGGSGTPAPAAPAAEAKPEKVSPLVKRFDKDGDGKLNEEEKAAAQAELSKGKKKEKGDKAKDKDDKKPAEKAGK